VTGVVDQPSTVFARRALIIGLGTTLIVGAAPARGFAQDVPESPPTVRMTCGTCPPGYAVTGVTQAPGVCREDDPTLVECVPLGANPLAVCGSCPEGYVEIGSSSVPARCGGGDGGRLTQCQLQKMEQSFPDPSQGMKFCPPDCGNTPTPGQGALPPPPKYQRAPEEK